MYCKHCGTELSADAAYCTSCGKPVSAQPAISRADRGLLLIGVFSFVMQVVMAILTQITNQAGSWEREVLYRVFDIVGCLWLAVPFLIAYYTRYKPYKTILFILAVLYVLMYIYRYFLDAAL